MTTSYGEVARLLRIAGIERYEFSDIPGSATYAEQREKVKQWLLS